MTAACAAHAAEPTIDLDSRFWSKVVRPTWTDCWIWMGARGADRYGSFRVGSSTARAHRHAYELVNGAIPAGLVVRHRCDVRLCVCPDHLEVGTPADNMKDMVERGRASRGEAAARRGEAHGMAKLSEARVRCMLAKHAAGGCTQQSLAVEFGVSFQHVSDIILGKRWSHLRGGGR